MRMNTDRRENVQKEEDSEHDEGEVVGLILVSRDIRRPSLVRHVRSCEHHKECDERVGVDSFERIEHVARQCVLHFTASFTGLERMAAGCKGRLIVRLGSNVAEPVAAWPPWLEDQQNMVWLPSPMTA